MRRIRETATLVAAALLIAATAGDAPAQATPEEPPPARQDTLFPDSLEFQTKAGFAACATMARLAQLTAHVAKGESAAYRAMLDDRATGCFLLRGGVDVTPVGHNGYVVELRPVGMRGTIFTVVEAVEPKRPS